MSTLNELEYFLDATDDDKIAAILPEIELEVAIRKRVAKTLEDRIAWAQSLRESLTCDRSFGQPAFKDAALDALAKIEQPLDFLRDKPPPSMLGIDPSPDFVSAPPKLSRPPPKPSAPLQSRKHGRFLFTRSGAQLFTLACPSCHKTQFSSLQGLYNHARIMHQLEWGTHEECVRACSVPRGEFDLENGVEITVALLGVRGLFQKVVEEQSASVEAKNVNLNDTLGLHAETPALAAVLGKEVKRRKIQVYDQDVDIDIDTLDEQPKRWRPAASFRNITRDSEDEDDPGQTTQTIQSRVGEDQSYSTQVTVTAASRFHISARVIVTDRSLYIPPEIRPNDCPSTHKWMISVEAPSYSLDITTILQRVTATSLSDYMVFSPMVKDEPPFILMGVASRPFLCHLELLFNPTRSRDIAGQPIVLEHWIDLDVSKAKYVVKGEEQVVDVELHKETTILPPIKGYSPVDARVHWKGQDGLGQDASSSEMPDGVKSEISIKQPPQTDSSSMLRGILASYPLTRPEHSSKKLPSEYLPYRLVSRPEFHGLIAGRRKSIEWCRAKAIRDAYDQAVKESGGGAGLSPLSTADVLRWLKNADACGVPTKPPSRQAPERQKWCLICGLSFDEHDRLDLERGCTVGDSVPKTIELLPIVDVDKLLHSPPHSFPAFTFIPNKQLWTGRRIVSVADPTLLLAIKDIIVKDLRLPTMSYPVGASRFPFGVGSLGHDELAPYGVLTLVLMRLVKRLISGGLKHLKGKVLTPTPVIRGVVAGQYADRTGQAVYYALARLGRKLEEDEMVDGARQW